MPYISLFQIVKLKWVDNPVRLEMSSTTCIECGSDLQLYEDLEVGEILDCQACGTELEVTGTEPVTLEYAPELAEDWGE